MARRIVEDLRSLIRLGRDRTFAYNPREERQRNWSSYNVTQIDEIADILEAIRDVVGLAVSRVHSEKNGPRRPPIPSEDVVKVMLMQAYFCIPNRAAQGFLRLFGEKLGIPSVSRTRQ